MTIPKPVDLEKAKTIILNCNTLNLRYWGSTGFKMMEIFKEILFEGKFPEIVDELEYLRARVKELEDGR